MDRCDLSEGSYRHSRSLGLHQSSRVIGSSSLEQQKGEGKKAMEKGLKLIVHNQQQQQQQQQHNSMTPVESQINHKQVLEVGGFDIHLPPGALGQKLLWKKLVEMGLKLIEEGMKRASQVEEEEGGDHNQQQQQEQEQDQLQHRSMTPPGFEIYPKQFLEIGGFDVRLGLQQPELLWKKKMEVGMILMEEGMRFRDDGMTRSSSNPKLVSQEEEEGRGHVQQHQYHPFQQYQYHPPMTPAESELYHKQVRESGGFDVNIHPGSVRKAGYIFPKPDFYKDPRMFETVNRCASMAIDLYNKEHNAQYRFTRVVKLCCMAVAGFRHYITFEAKAEGADPMYFQALVYSGIPEEHIEASWINHWTVQPKQMA